MLVVIFGARIRLLDSEYSEMAARIRELALKNFGCIHFQAVTEGREELVLSFWHSEADVRACKSHPEHLLAQKAGQERWYESYTVQIATVTREYSVSN